MKQFTMKAIGLLTLLLAFGWVQAQKTETPSPIFQADPNSESYDATKEDWVAKNPQAYQAMTQTAEKAVEAPVAPWGAPENKTQWISEHPREFAAMTAARTDNRTVLTKAQLATFPAEKQAAILKDSNFLIID